MFQKISNDVGSVPFRMLGLKHEAGILLVAFGREADVIELDLIRS